jgi:transporter family protein
MWRYYALLSALFAGFTAVLAKFGLQGISSNIATAIRTLVILFIAWGIVFAGGEVKDLHNLTKKHLLFLTLSGVATGLSWIFYFKALAAGPVSKVAPIDKLSVAIAIILSAILLKEEMDVKTITGALLIMAGTFVLIR